MSEQNLRPRGTSEIIDAAFALYRRDFTKYVLVAALASTPGLVLSLALTGGAPPTTIADFSRIIPALLINVVTTTLMTAVVQKAGSRVYLGGDVDLPSTVAKVAPKLLTLIVASVLLGFLFMFGLLFLLVGAVWVAVRWFAVALVIVLEDKGPFSSFSRAFSLTRGGDIQWHVLKTLLLLLVLYIILMVFASGASLIISYPPARVMVQTALTVIASPVLALSSMVLYYDLRIRKEAFDLEQMTDALGVDATPRMGGASA